MKNNRIIYDSDYYKIQLMINDDNFINRTNELLKSFNKFKCPIPKDGLKNHQEYSEWSNKYFGVRSQIQSSDVLKNKISKITNGKEFCSLKEKTKIDLIIKKALPPVFHSIINDILLDYGIDKNHKSHSDFHDFVFDFIFFKKTEYNNNSLTITYLRNKHTNELDLFIKILPNTKIEDIEKNWSMIKDEQKGLSGYREKNKQNKNFYRDLEIHKLYKNLKAQHVVSKQKGEGIHRNKNPDQLVCSIILEKYGDDLCWDAIRKIVSNVDKLYKSVNFKRPL